MKKKKVLILEDTTSHFEKLEIEFLQKEYDVYPNEDDDEWDFIALREMFRDIVENENINAIDKIVEKYKNVCDVYVIDRELASRTDDKLGMTFYREFLKAGIQKKDIFIVSTHPKESLGISVDDSQFQKKQKSFASLLIKNID